MENFTVAVSSFCACSHEAVRCSCIRHRIFAHSYHKLHHGSGQILKVQSMYQCSTDRRQQSCAGDAQRMYLKVTSLPSTFKLLWQHSLRMIAPDFDLGFSSTALNPLCLLSLLCSLIFESSFAEETLLMSIFSLWILTLRSVMSQLGFSSKSLDTFWSTSSSSECCLYCILISILSVIPDT